jgi:hypothetical protein
MGSLLSRSPFPRMDTSILTVCKETSKDSLPLMFGLDTWVRVLIKAVSSDALSYTWHEMTFCSRWDPHRCLVLCIGVNPTFQHLLQQTLSRMWSKFLPSEPFSLHIPLVQAILELQDSSVWSIRDVVRNIEKASIVDAIHPLFDFKCTGPLTFDPWLPGLHHDARDGKARYSLF